jgi:GNAT superfamily N-acetyltransferase
VTTIDPREAGPTTTTTGTDVARRETFRRATPDDLVACATVWRHALNDYLPRRGEPEVPDDLGSLIRLYAYLQRTDADGFVVAEEPDLAPDPITGRIVGFVASYRRQGLWFLSMLFVLPDRQGRGLGRRLLDRVAPDTAASWRGTATDTAQPISNGLYGSLGIVPRMPLFHLIGYLERPSALQPLRAGVEAVPFAESDAAGILAGEIDDIDRATLGVEHRVDHDYLRAEGRLGFLYRDAGGGAIGYGYAAPTGRIGPVGVRDATDMAGITGDLATRVEARGAQAIWAPGAAGDTVTSFLRAGFRFDGFPVLLCWDRPFADFARYLPNSPGLL